MTYNTFQQTASAPVVHWQPPECGAIQSIELDDCPATVQIAKFGFANQQWELWSSWLGDQEKSRLSLYRFECDRDLFIARRGLARFALHERTQFRPEDIAFHSSESGKLIWGLKSDSKVPNSHSPDFSITSNPDYVAVAVAGRMNRVGIDIERLPSMNEFEGMIEHVLHPKEYERWKDLDPPNQIEAYTNLYVVKEAFAKAIGRHASFLPSDCCAMDVLDGHSNSVVILESKTQSATVGLYWTCNVELSHRLAIVVV